jgi:Paraquat-inducible protein A
MIAQLICQITSHYIVYYHRRIVTVALNRQLDTRPAARGSDTLGMFDEEFDESVDSDPPLKGGRVEEQYLMSTPPQRLCLHAFQRAHKAENGKLVTRRIVTPLVILTAMVITALVVLGCVMPTFSVNVLGLIGVLVESGQGFVAADTSYSMFGLLEVMFAQAQMTATTQDYVGLGSLAVIVVGTVLCVPIVQVCALLVQWFMRLSFRQRKRLSLTIEILQAWQYMEVYLLSVVVAAWQLGPISCKFIYVVCI